MSLIISNNNGILIAMPNGRLDTNTAPDAEKQIVQQIEGGETKAVFDFSNTEIVYSSKGLPKIMIKGFGVLSFILLPKPPATIIAVTFFFFIP